jgi:hypothetical protein
MRNLAKKLDRDAVLQEVGTITRVDGRAFTVRTSSGDVEARRATSCLVEPDAGDRVLLSGCSEGWYVLAILARDEGEAGAAIALDGDLTVRLRSGRFVVAAQEGVEIVSGGDVSVASGRIDVNAAEGNVTLGRLTFLGTLVRAEIDKIKLFAGHLDSVVDRVAARVKRSYRFVEESDQVRAERIDYVAKKTASVHGENMLLTAEELVKIDGEQIHVG